MPGAVRRRNLRSGFVSVGRLVGQQLRALVRAGKRAMAEDETPVKMRRGQIVRSAVAKAREAAIAADTSSSFLCVGDAFCLYSEDVDGYVLNETSRCSLYLQHNTFERFRFWVSGFGFWKSYSTKLM